MGDNTGISWCDDSRNLWWGCVEVSAQCDNCYARTLDHRFGGEHWGAHNARLIQPKVWKAFNRAQIKAEKEGTVRTQFVQSMGDIFEKAMPLVNGKGEAVLGGLTTDYSRTVFFRNCVPNTPNLYYLLLTKRPQNIKNMIPAAWLVEPPKIVMYGCSIGSGSAEQDAASLRALLSVPGRHFVSIEPLLGAVSLTNISVLEGNVYNALSGEYFDSSGTLKGVGESLDWVIVGGESGPHARPTNPQRVRDIRDACERYSVPFFFKQWGEWVQSAQDDTQGESVIYEEEGRTDYMYKLGRKNDPCTLDGVAYYNKPDFKQLVDGEQL